MSTVRAQSTPAHTMNGIGMSASQALLRFIVFGLAPVAAKNAHTRRPRPAPNRTETETVPCHAVPCHAVPCRAVPCRAVPCRA
eukprot:2171297-Prymnesium_polylepis.1